MDCAKNQIPFVEIPSGEVKNDFKEEPMVSISRYFGNRLLVEPAYFLRKIPGAPKDCLARWGTIKRLEMALELLPRELTFKVYDAWRPLCVQKALYDDYYAGLAASNPHLQKEELGAETIKFVSKPNYNMESPAVHSTGGAIDLTLVQKSTGEELSMGTAFDDFTPLSFTNAFETASDTQIRDNRRLLYGVMTRAGFTNLPTEWWHYDYGDRFWAYYNNKPAIYRGIDSEESV